MLGLPHLGPSPLCPRPVLRCRFTVLSGSSGLPSSLAFSAGNSLLCFRDLGAASLMGPAQWKQIGVAGDTRWLFMEITALDLFMFSCFSIGDFLSRSPSIQTLVPRCCLHLGCPLYTSLITPLLISQCVWGVLFCLSFKGFSGGGLCGGLGFTVYILASLILFLI